MNAPRIRYAKSGDISIAYQNVGEGPLTIVFAPGWISHVEILWEDPVFAEFMTNLSGFARVLLFDKRGTGASDRDVGYPTLDDRMDDIRAVMDDAGVERAAIFGASEGGNMACMFAAAHPERVSHLILFGVFAKREWSPDYPWAPTREERDAWIDMIEKGWGGTPDISDLAPSRANDPGFAEWFGRMCRLSASPGAAVGDAAWQALMQRHNSAVRAILRQRQGAEINTTGDGFLASFASPARALHAALDVHQAMKPLGLGVRAGVHTGECQRSGTKVEGVAINIAVRVAALAGAGEVAASRTVRDLTIGAAMDFASRGEHALKGAPGAWEIFAVSPRA
jgi:pimeloyl-ACP methyl ester carboxylesterase